MKLLNLKTLAALLLGAAPVLLGELAKLPGPYGALAGSLLAVVLLHSEKPGAVK